MFIPAMSSLIGTRSTCLTFVLGGLVAVSAVMGRAESKAGPSFTYRAIGAFSPAPDERYVPYYRENKTADSDLHGIAVNTVHYQDRPSAAEMTFRGTTGVYDLNLTTLVEADGESVYQICVNGRELGVRANPESAENRQPVELVWNQVVLNSGDRIRVVFRGHSNGRVPEGDGFGWSRARWRSLTVSAAGD